MLARYVSTMVVAVFGYRVTRATGEVSTSRPEQQSMMILTRPRSSKPSSWFSNSSAAGTSGAQRLQPHGERVASERKLGVYTHVIYVICINLDAYIEKITYIYIHTLHTFWNHIRIV